MRDIEIREAGELDLDAVVRCRASGALSSFGERAERLGLKEELLALLASRSDARRDIQSSTRHVLLATDDRGVALGTAMLHVANGSYELSAGYCVVRNCGVGSALARALIELAARMGAYSVWCEVDEANPAGRAIATRTGFERTGCREGKLLKDALVVRYELTL